MLDNVWFGIDEAFRSSQQPQLYCFLPVAIFCAARAPMAITIKPAQDLPVRAVRTVLIRFGFQFCDELSRAQPSSRRAFVSLKNNHFDVSVPYMHLPKCTAMFAQRAFVRAMTDME